jgi:hypothetical protein
MTISTHIQDLIQQEMALGGYARADDVVLHAIQALRAEREMCADDTETLAGIRRGLAESAAGQGRPWREADRDFLQRKQVGDET